MKTYRQCWWAVLAAGGLCLLVFAIFQLFPFAGNTLSWCDMNQQVVPLLLDLKQILAGQADLFLNLANAGGMDFWGVFLFFLSSPLSFLVVFVPVEQIFLFANLLVLLKVMICAGTASVFFRSRFAALPLMQNLALSVLYAFCGYTMMYFQNVVWLDMMYLFPLLLLAMYRLIERGQVWPYIAVLTAMITVQFYLSYMVALFLILAIGVYTWLCIEREQRRRVICLFGVSTLVTLLTTGVVWLPALLEFLSSARGGGLLQNLTSGSLVTELQTTLPVLLCTAALLAGLPMYWICKGYRSREGRAVGILLGLLLIPVFLEPVNKMWHTGSYQAFPMRYGYMIVFLGLALLGSMLNCFAMQGDGQVLTTGGRVGLWGGLGAGLLAVIGTGIALLVGEWDTLATYTKTLHGSFASLGTQLLFALAVAVFCFFLFLLRYLKVLPKRVVSVFFCLITVVQVLFCGSVYFGSAARSTESDAAVLDLQGRLSQEGLYRVKMQRKYFDVNLVGALGYGSLSHYTSLTNEGYLYAMKKLGYSSYWMEVGSHGGTTLTDCLLANRYRIVRNTELGRGLEAVYQNDWFSIVEHVPEAGFGMVFATDEIAQAANLPDTTRADVQNQIFQTPYGTQEQVAVEYQPSTVVNVEYAHENGRYTLQRKIGTDAGYLLYTVTVQGTQTLYFDCFDALSNKLTEPINGTFDIAVNGRTVQNLYPSQSSNGLLELGTFTDETVVVRAQVRKSVVAKSLGVVGIKQEVLRQFAGQQSGAVQLQRQGNTLTGTVQASGDEQYLFLPVGYAKGFSAWVNGQKAEIYTVFDAFMAVKLQDGENVVTVSYVPDGFATGAALTAAGVLLGAGLVWLLRRGGYCYLRFVEVIAGSALAVLFGAVLLAVYIAPVAIYLFL